MRSLKKLAPLLLLAALVGFCAYRDYRFAPNAISKLTRQGWTVATTNDNFVSVSHPWSIFHPPTTMLWLMQIDKAQEISPGVFAIPELRVRYDYEDVESEENLAVYDVIENRQTVVRPGTAIDSLDLSNLKWFTPEPNTPGEALMTFVRRSVPSPVRSSE